jgi:hypothetical protein
LLSGYWRSAHSTERCIRRNRSATAWASDIVHRLSPFKKSTRKQIANGLQTPLRWQANLADGVAGEKGLQVLYSVLSISAQQNLGNCKLEVFRARILLKVNRK